MFWKNDIAIAMHKKNFAANFFEMRIFVVVVAVMARWRADRCFGRSIAPRFFTYYAADSPLYVITFKR